MRLSFYGAARTVTGSRFLVDGHDARLLVDCGMFQGQRELRRLNWAEFAVPAESIDAVVLSHAHLDHTGWLPRLVVSGFSGPVWCSLATAELAAIVLRDAAHLQEEDACRANEGGYSKHRPALPLFDAAAAEKAIALLRPLPFAHTATVGGLRVRLHRAGHILGSATVAVADAGSTVLFSGDLGGGRHPLLVPPDPPLAADAIVVESTYGDRLHPKLDLDRLAATMSGCLDRGGVVLMPAFAVDRTPMLLMTLRRLMTDGRLPRVPVYVDSPMALAALEVYRTAVAQGAADLRTGLPAEPFDTGTVRLVGDATESERLNRPGRACILISASGMVTGGRVVHHVAALAPDPANLIVLPGFQVPGTRGQALADGATAIKAFGRYVPVRAGVVALEEFSSHADADAILRWLAQAPRTPSTVFVVHGEPPASAALAARVMAELGWPAVVVEPDERVIV